MLIVEPCPMMCRGIVQTLSAAGLCVVGDPESIDGDEALRLAADVRLHVAIVDLCAADGRSELHVRGGGFTLIKDLRLQSPRTRTLVCALPLPALLVRHLFAIGAAGYILSSALAAEWIAAVGTLAAGKVYLAVDAVRGAAETALSNEDDDPERVAAQLSPSELEVVHLLGSGQDTHAIAKVLHRSVKTIQTYRSRIAAKLGLRGATALAQWTWQFVHRPFHPCPTCTRAAA